MVDRLESVISCNSTFATLSYRAQPTLTSFIVLRFLHPHLPYLPRLKAQVPGKVTSLPATGLAPGWSQDFQRPSGDAGRKRRGTAYDRVLTPLLGHQAAGRNGEVLKAFTAPPGVVPALCSHNATLVPASLGFFSAASWSPGLTSTPQTRALIGTRVNSPSTHLPVPRPSLTPHRWPRPQARLLTKDSAPLPLSASWLCPPASVLESSPSTGCQTQTMLCPLSFQCLLPSLVLEAVFILQGPTPGRLLAPPHLLFWRFYNTTKDTLL